MAYKPTPNYVIAHTLTHTVAEPGTVVEGGSNARRPVLVARTNVVLTNDKS